MNVEPKRFVNQAAQGDVFIRRVEKIPAGAACKKQDGPVIVAHSETGHHHAFNKYEGVTYYETNDPTIAYLSVATASVLEHMRSFDTHAAILFEPGSYELRRPVEDIDEDEQRMVED